MVTRRCVIMMTSLEYWAFSFSGPRCHAYAVYNAKSFKLQGCDLHG